MARECLGTRKRNSGISTIGWEVFKVGCNIYKNKKRTNPQNNLLRWFTGNNIIARWFIVYSHSNEWRYEIIKRRPAVKCWTWSALNPSVYRTGVPSRGTCSAICVRFCLPINLSSRSPTRERKRWKKKENVDLARGFFWVSFLFVFSHS